MDYFIASDDADAARVLPGSGGPTPLGFDTLSTKGIDPAITMGTLESIITDRSYDEVTAAPRHCHPLTDTDADAFVVTVTDALRDAVAAADDQHLRQVAQRWADTDELAGVTPEDLVQLLDRFAVLARDAVDRGHHMYCWWAL